MIILAKYLYLFIIFVVFIFFIKEKKRWKKIVFFATGILSISFLLSRIVSKIYYNPRPFVSKHFIPLIEHTADNGFPSDHSLVSFAFASIVFIFNRKLGVVLYVLSFLVGLSRIYVGVHSYIDILGSFLICIIAMGICATIASWKKQ